MSAIFFPHPLSESQTPHQRQLLLCISPYQNSGSLPHGLHSHTPHRERKSAGFFHVVQNLISCITFYHAYHETPLLGHCLQHKLRYVTPENESVEAQSATYNSKRQQQAAGVGFGWLTRAHLQQCTRTQFGRKMKLVLPSAQVFFNASVLYMALRQSPTPSTNLLRRKSSALPTLLNASSFKRPRTLPHGLHSHSPHSECRLLPCDTKCLSLNYCIRF